MWKLLIDKAVTVDLPQDSQVSLVLQTLLRINVTDSVQECQWVVELFEALSRDVEESPIDSHTEFHSDLHSFQ